MIRTVRILLAVFGGVFLNSTLDSVTYKDPAWKWKLLCSILCILGSFATILIDG